MSEHLVIGGGVIGLTTALELLRRGQKVRLLDAAAGAGLGTSFANGGLLTPSMSDPWNAPGVHRHLVEYLVRSDSALKIRAGALPSLLTWGPRFLLNSRPARHNRTSLANLELSKYSLVVLDELRREYALEFDSSDAGSLKIFRSQEALDAALAITGLLAQNGLEARTLDRGGAVEVEPCLADIRDEIVGAIHYPGDAAGDAHLFCRAAASLVERLGGVIDYGRPVRAIDVRGGRVAGVRVDGESLSARSVVLAAGVASPRLASRLGPRLRIKPVKGYSITYELGAANRRPRLPVIDDAYHAAVTPLGSRLRVAGTAEFAGNDVRLDPKRIANLSRLIEAIFPGLVDARAKAGGKGWAGLRPVAADGRPYVGRGGVEGLWVNSGHGHLGWTMAAGSARMLGDLITGSRPEVDPAPFRVDR